ncbi:hypothetical protein [Lewinella sp. LCG006]|uniref:hypothetical protein n=1 Tax=Lewinella sp. LCG006 TaxID=3231911 RepID=UPI00345F5081
MKHQEKLNPHLYLNRSKMKRVFYILLIITCSCAEQSKFDNEQEDTPNIYSQIILVDTFQSPLTLDTASTISESSFHPLFIGHLSDSIPLNYSTWKVVHQTTEWDTYPMPDSLGLALFVDTSKIVGSGIRYLPPLQLDREGILEWELIDVRGGIKSYPVFVTNLTSDTLNIGYGAFLPIIIQAVDSAGNWKPIQNHYRYFCGTGLTHFYLPVGEILITSCPLYEGAYRTRLRLAFGWDRINYSNEFFGTIDYRQFVKPKQQYY